LRGGDKEGLPGTARCIGLRRFDSRCAWAQHLGSMLIFPPFLAILNRLAGRLFRNLVWPLMTASVKSYDFLDPPSQSGDLGMLGHYRVISELGRGGMGFVFRAEDSRLKRTVALKVMNQKIAATPHSRRRFMEEARAMAAVHHDNVVTIFEVGESEGTPFMAMEMLRGNTLESLNKAKTQLNYEQIIDFSRQIARGLAAAHANKIVHRDIKPANIWIEEGAERIKILDFGLALASTPVDHLSGRGAVIGTPGYLSPEQARSDSLDDRSDLYSLGVVLYELCCGQLPIRAKSVSEQLISILAHRPTPINEINPDVPKPLCDMVHRLLRKEPRKRPASAAALVEELQRVEEECHAKSEVAQTINKLQMGLSDVFNKTETETFFDSIDESIPDPLAAAPDPFAAAPDPLGPAPVTMVPPARPLSKSAAPASNPPAWLAYWPLAAVGAVVLIALPLLTYAFSGKGSRTDPVVVTDTSTVSSDDSSASQAAGSATTQPSQQPPAPNRSRAAEENPVGRRGGQGNGGQARRNRGNRNQQNRGDTAQSNAPPTSASAGRQDSTERVAAPPPSQPAPVAAVSGVPTGAQPETSVSQSEAAAEPPATAPQAAVELAWTIITTGEGRGADTIVENNASQKQGLRPSIGVASRKRVETHHSYLRFDLAKIENVKSHIESAGIILTLVAKEPAVGAEVRVYGMEDVALWPEQELDWKTSYSPKRLDSLPLLGETTVTAENASQINGRAVVRVTGPEFAKFITSAGDTVTMVIAGSGAGSQVLRFFSRESPVKAPPALLIQAPKTAPPAEQKATRNKRKQ
jgi:serine/threonine protein kinase